MISSRAAFSSGIPVQTAEANARTPDRRPVELKDKLLQYIGIDMGRNLEQLTRLKKDVAEILSSCDGNCLYLSKFKKMYKQTFGKKFKDIYVVPKGKNISHLMAELDIIELEKQAEKGAKKFLMKLKEPQASQFMMNMALNTVTVIDQLSSSSDVGYQQEELDSNIARKPHEPLISGGNSAVVASPLAESIPVVPPTPLNENTLDVRHQSPASATVTFAHASPLPLSQPLLPVSSVANIGMCIDWESETHKGLKRVTSPCRFRTNYMYVPKYPLLQCT